VRELEQLGVKSAWLDGEIVVLGDDGAPDFNALQKSFDHPKSSTDIIYFLFDVPYFEGYDLRDVELVARRQLLKALLEEKATDHLRYSAAFEADPASILSSACRMNLEGVIAKRSDAPYASRRTETWLKLKCKQRQEFVVCGYTDRSDGSAQVGSLLLGVHAANGELLSVGSVGTGWSSQEAGELKRKLGKLEVSKVPFPAGASKPGRWSKRAAGSERWVEPRIVAEVEFAEWTADGKIRHASYVGLRSDKPASAIVRETAETVAGSAPATPANKAKVGGVKVSNAERVIDPSSGMTKLHLVRYYESVAPWILPHLKGRPCSLVRGPTGVTGQLFFQKHGEKIGIPGIKELDASLWPGHDALLEVGTAQALTGAAQMNVIEFHTWNSLARNIDKPDRMIFDLDPGEGTVWQHIQEAAMLVRALLSELGLEAWLKTSGGKGLHVVVPLTPRLDYDTVKSFSQAVVQHLARTLPSRFVAKSGPANRVGKLFVDYLRNGHGATTAAAFSARARPGLGVSMPVSWDDLAKLKSGAQWNVATTREYLSFETSDPWADYWKRKQSLSGAMKTLGFRPSKTGT
jgi:bifunctional non-homologous end joining protein LigD